MKPEPLVTAVAVILSGVEMAVYEVIVAPPLEAGAV